MHAMLRHWYWACHFEREAEGGVTVADLSEGYTELCTHGSGVFTVLICGASSGLLIGRIPVPHMKTFYLITF